MASLGGLSPVLSSRSSGIMMPAEPESHDIAVAYCSCPHGGKCRVRLLPEIIQLIMCTDEAVKRWCMLENARQLDRLSEILLSTAPSIHCQILQRVFGIEPTVAECRKFFAAELDLEGSILLWNVLLLQLETDFSFSFDRLMKDVSLHQQVLQDQPIQRSAVLVAKFSHLYCQMQKRTTSMGSFYNLAASDGMKHMFGWSLQLLEEKNIGLLQLIRVETTVDFVTHRIRAAVDYLESLGPPTEQQNHHLLDEASCLLHAYDIALLEVLTVTGHFLPCRASVYLVFSRTRFPLMIALHLSAF